MNANKIRKLAEPQDPRKLGKIPKIPETIFSIPAIFGILLFLQVPYTQPFVLYLSLIIIHLLSVYKTESSLSTIT